MNSDAQPGGLPAQAGSDNQPVRKREAAVTSAAGSLRAEVVSASGAWSLDGAAGSSSPDPVTAFLGALGGCLLMSLAIAARARKLELGRSSARVRSNQTGHVKEIQVELEVQTALDDAALRRLVEVAERGCHIKAMLRTDIAFDLRLHRVAG